MPYAATITRATTRQEEPVTSTPAHPSNGLGPSSCRLLRAVDRAQAATARAWVSVTEVQRVHPDAPTYDRARYQLHRLATAGYLRVSPKGQPPGAGGLLFTTTPHATRALTGVCSGS